MKIQLNKTNILEAYKNSTKEGKEAIKLMIGKENVPTEIESFKTIDDVLNHFGTTDFRIQYIFERDKYTSRYQYLIIAELIAEALNDGWKPDFKDINQKKLAICAYYTENNGKINIQIDVCEVTKAKGYINLLLKSEDIARNVIDNSEFLNAFLNAYGINY